MKQAKGIYLRGRVYWMAVQVGGVRKFISLQTSDPVEAMKRAQEVRRSPDLAPRSGLEAEIAAYLRAKERSGRFTSPTTAKWAGRALKKLQTAYPIKSAAQISAQDIEALVDQLKRTMAETGAMSYMRAREDRFLPDYLAYSTQGPQTQLHVSAFCQRTHSRRFTPPLLRASG